MKKNAVTLLIAVVALLSVGIFSLYQTKPAGESIADEVVVYQSRTCGCCKKWVAHLQENGFKVRSEMMDDVTEIKRKENLPMKLASCHTAKINGYIVEGHVPAVAIRKLLAEKPNLKGISVPGMPMGSPGMEGSHKESFDVVSFDENGSEQVFMSF